MDELEFALNPVTELDFHWQFGTLHAGQSLFLFILLANVKLFSFLQAGFGYQQQLIPGMRTGTAPMPNFYMPFVQQGQPGHRPGGRRAGGGPVQQTQQPVPLGQQQASEFCCCVSRLF